MSNNIHGFGDFSSVGKVDIQSSNSYSSQDDKIFQTSLYKMSSVTFFLLVINISIYVFQLFSFYSYFVKNKNSWSCLLVTYGAFQAGKIKNHHQYYRFFTSMALHSSMAHMGSNSLSLFFLGFQTENELNSKIKFLLLYIISGLSGNFMSLLFNINSISVGASGAIIGLCGNFVIYFLLNYRRMGTRKKYSYGILFLFLFINLFSGLSEGGENINMACHIGGFLGGFAYSIILAYKDNYNLKNNNSFARRLYYYSICFLILLPLISTGFIAYKKVLNSTDYICK